MQNKFSVMAAVLSVLLFLGMSGCAQKAVRHLASDVCLISPEKTTKEQVVTYLGQPDAQYEMEDGTESWVYYEVKKSTLQDTPYIGDKIGDKKYEMVKVTFGNDIVQTCVYRLLSEEEFSENGLVQ